MQSADPAARDLVLVGGGHAHALVLRKLAMTPPPGLRITLISPAAFTPYSGMLPGLLAGHYSFEETHIELQRLCQWAGVRFLNDTVEALDPARQCLRCRTRGEVFYDILSIDIGSQPELDSVPGAREHAVPVKPVAGLWARWQELAAAEALGDSRLAVVGGGAGSVEIILAIAHRLAQRRPRLALYCGAGEVLPGYSRGLRRTVERQLATLGVDLHCGHRVERVSNGTLHFAGGATAGFDTLIWSTGASAAPWIADSGIDVDERGFMRVEDTLQSSSHPTIFGAGDIATQYRNPRPKAGVYAVRQGPVLADNLAALCAGRSLKRHQPQSGFLSILALGPQRAVAERNGFSLAGDWVWRWKDRIDREFMQRFSQLPPRRMPAPKTPAGAQAPCGGCGAKVSADALGEVLATLAQKYPQHTPGEQSRDDTALLDAPAPLLQSIDALRALVDDPWRMGRIAAQHALSDLYASGASPHSALALVTLPFASAALQRRDLLQALDGALSMFAAADCRLIGGHSMQGPEFQLAFAVNGVLGGRPPLRKHGARSGDVLLLSKPLGSGALFALQMLARADGRHVEAALTSMEQSNRDAAAIARAHGATALTDVTGFGFAGHLLEMLEDEQSARIDLAALPVLPGALDAMEQGVFSTLHAANRDAVIDRCRLPAQAPVAAQLLFDPQTSGGLLMAVPAARAEAALTALCDAGCAAARVGEVGAAEHGVALELRIS